METKNILIEKLLDMDKNIVKELTDNNVCVVEFNCSETYDGIRANKILAINNGTSIIPLHSLGKIKRGCEYSGLKNIQIKSIDYNLIKNITTYSIYEVYQDYQKSLEEKQQQYKINK